MTLAAHELAEKIAQRLIDEHWIDDLTDTLEHVTAEIEEILLESGK